MYVLMHCTASRTNTTWQHNDETLCVDVCTQHFVTVCRIYKYFTESQYRQWIGAL